MTGDVTIRIWNGCKVVMVVSVGMDGSSTTLGAMSGAHNSTQADIDFDPWANLIVDHRAEHPHPVSTREAEDD